MDQMMMIECEYRNHSKIWIQLGYIESVAEVKGGSVIRMASGTIHDILDTPEDILKKVLTTVQAARTAGRR